MGNRNGYGGLGYLHALPDIDLLSQTQTLTDSPVSQYPIRFTTPGTYTLWSRSYADSGDADSLYVGLNGPFDGAQDRQVTGLSGFTPEEWNWANQQLSTGDPATFAIENSGLYTLTASIREDGLRLDRMLLTTDTTYLPSGVGPEPTLRQRGQTVIHYTYDGLHRLTEADYSTSESFGYAYDPMGNQTVITETIHSTTVTTYTYDTANRLTTAKAGNSEEAWYYTYDNKGNLLRQIPGGTAPANGETRYTYDAADRLIKVELYTGGSYTLLSEAEYNGDGERVALTTYALGTPQTVSYVNGADGLLVADDGSTETLYLYGQTQIAEYDGGWNYPLRDSNASVRQTVDEAGSITSTQSYKPFGGILEEQGTYETTFGFLGSQLDRLSGLLYANGRYYDPATGRYLTPNHTFDPLRPGTLNPYAPLQGPWWLLLPFVGIVFAWKGRRQSGSWHMFILILVVGVSLTLVSCGASDQSAREYRVGDIPGVQLIPLESWVSGGGTGIDWSKQELCTEEEQSELLANNPSGYCILTYTNPKNIIDTSVIHHGAIVAADPYDGVAYFNKVLESHLTDPGMDNFAVAYHFGVDPLGKTYEGRPIGMRGYHVAPDSSGRGNTGRLGILLFGNFNMEHPTPNQLSGTVDLINGLKGAGYGLRYLSGHRDHNDTECPGDNLTQDILEDLARQTGLELVNFR